MVIRGVFLLSRFSKNGSKLKWDHFVFGDRMIVWPDTSVGLGGLFPDTKSKSESRHTFRCRTSRAVMP